jgi:hypothetical protein
MNLILLLRPPVVWLVALEAVIVAVLGVASWHAWQAGQPPAHAAAAPPAKAAAGSPVSRRGGQPPPSAAPSPAAPGVVPQAGPTPAILSSSDFLSRQMGELNRVEASFEALEWRMTKALVDAIQYYIDHVVLPSLDHAQRAQR